VTSRVAGKAYGERGEVGEEVYAGNGHATHVSLHWVPSTPNYKTYSRQQAITNIIDRAERRWRFTVLEFLPNNVAARGNRAVARIITRYL
jgi:hypothetical protein